MEQKLKRLFDYQKFQRNSRLEAMLAEAEGRCAEVDDDALELVSAAGCSYEPMADPNLYEGMDPTIPSELGMQVQFNMDSPVLFAEGESP